MNSVKPIKNKGRGMIVHHYEINDNGVNIPINDNIDFKMDIIKGEFKHKKKSGWDLFVDVKKVDF